MEVEIKIGEPIKFEKLPFVFEIKVPSPMLTSYDPKSQKYTITINCGAVEPYLTFEEALEHELLHIVIAELEGYKMSLKAEAAIWAIKKIRREQERERAT